MKIDYSKYAGKVEFWKGVVEKAKNFTGTSPPSVFVGRFGFPKVFVGILSPTQHESNAGVLDSPEDWYRNRASIGDILGYRGQMVYSRFVSDVNAGSKLLDVTQQVAMAKSPADVEIELAKNPVFKFDFDKWSQPIGNPAPIMNASLASNPSTKAKVDYLISDMDAKAQDAVVELSSRVPMSQLQKIFSVGLLGTKSQRKLVPTRWAITAVDDMVSKALVEKILDYPEVDGIMLFHNEYLGNHYEILVLPGNYQMELVEIWNVDNPQPSIDQDYENYWLRETYASTTGGAFYSSRYAVGMHLEKIKRQASVLIVREVRPSYDVPMGIWQLREAVKDAFNQQHEKFGTVEQAVARICSRLVSKDKWVNESKLLKLLKTQSTLRKFTNG
ncbi:hypothetical protein EPN87_00860 [archaeon]|nr:MAG: hypothetical protein EPN87_00860 [archaeon]